MAKKNFRVISVFKIIFRNSKKKFLIKIILNIHTHTHTQTTQFQISVVINVCMRRCLFNRGQLMLPVW